MYKLKIKNGEWEITSAEFDMKNGNKLEKMKYIIGCDIFILKSMEHLLKSISLNKTLNVT